MDLAELHAITERERQTRKPIRIRCCVAAGCLSANAQAVKQRLEESVAGAGLQEQVEVCGVGCLRLCSRGPLVQVDPDNAGFLSQPVFPHEQRAAAQDSGFYEGAVRSAQVPEELHVGGKIGRDLDRWIRRVLPAGDEFPVRLFLGETGDDFLHRQCVAVESA